MILLLSFIVLAERSLAFWRMGCNTLTMGRVDPQRLLICPGAQAGMLVVLCFFGFGLTEVIFWSVKGSLFYALMIFMLMGLCLNAKENDGK